MSNDSSMRVQCCLDVRGTAKANADAIQDLGVDDPSPDVAMAAIREVVEGEGDGATEEKQKTASQGSPTDH